MPPKPAPSLKHPLTEYKGSGVWLYAGVFLLANGLLSYGSFPLIPGAIIFLIGLALPFGLALRSPRPVPGKQAEGFSRIPDWVWAALAALVLTSHFYRLESLRVWPNGDEGIAGFYSIQLSQKWDWRLFYAFGQIPPLSIWASAGLFKLGCSTRFSLWFPSALVSVLTVAAAIFAARQFFSKSASFLLGLLLATGYWPFILGRVCSEGVWLPLWVCLCVLFLGRFLNSGSDALSRKKEAAYLGFVLGLGPYTFTPWPVVVLWIFLIIFFNYRIQPKLSAAVPFLLFFFALAVTPFGWAALSQGYGEHIRSTFFFNSWFSLQEGLRTSFSYVSSLFWGSFDSPGSYDARGGGMLNPLLGSVFFIGSLELLRSRSRWKVLALGAALLLFLLPGMLSMNREMYRVVQIVPVIYAVAALGLLRLLLEAKARWRWIFLAVFFVLSLGIDGTRIFKTLPDPSDPATFVQRVPNHEEWLAYQAIEKIKESLGPGLVLSEFVADPDESLFDMAYPLNPAENPRLDSSPARWAAVLMDAHYFPFVSSRLAGSQWVWLDDKNSAKNLVLGVIPLTVSNRAMVENWCLAHHYFRMLNEAIFNITNPASYQKAQALFEEEPTFFKKDRFLEACYWERRGEFYYDYDYTRHYQDHVDALHQAIEKGYPAAQLYFKLGSLLLRKEDRLGALTAFRAALKADPQYEAAQSGLNLALSPAPSRP